MKTLKLALLGGAALAVTAAGAQADDLADLKAQIESLNARVAQMEAAPAVPAGYSLLTISEGSHVVVPGLEERDAASYGNKATVIGVLPTADAPAATEITWSGFARAAIVYTKDGALDWHEATEDRAGYYSVEDDLDVYARGEIKVVGKTETAVGEVGALVKVRGNFDGNGNANATMPEAWGWWAMTPELTLGGGYTGSLGNIGYGYDGACNCYYTDNADVAMNPGDVSQMRLSYASGPFSMAVALEDDTHSGGSWSDESLGAAAEIKYSGDTFNGEISGVWRSGDNDDDAGPGHDFYQVGAGVGFSLGDMASISLGAAMGQTHGNDDFWVASILASVNLSDAVHAEAAYGHKDYDSHDVDAVLAGIYYDPVSQLTIGLEGEWIDDESAYDDTFQVDLVTVFRF